MTEQDPSGFKVVDKRRFSDSGDEKAESEPRREVATDVPPHTTSSTADADNSQEQLNFSSFLFGMYTQSLIYLGEIPHPETNQKAPNFEAAKQNIDILGILEEKTKGNLTQDEEILFTEILNTLRLQFVKVKK